jgi:hypothetical protein
MQEKSILFPNFAHFRYQTLRHFATKLCGVPFPNFVTFGKLAPFILNFVVLIGNLAQIRSVIWRNYVRQFGIIPFGKMAGFCLVIWQK